MLFWKCGTFAKHTDRSLPRLCQGTQLPCAVINQPDSGSVLPGFVLEHCRSFPVSFGFQHGHRGDQRRWAESGGACPSRMCAQGGVRLKASHISEGHGNWRIKDTRMWTFLRWNPGTGPSFLEIPSWWPEGQEGNIPRDSAALPKAPSIFFHSHLPELH